MGDAKVRRIEQLEMDAVFQPLVIPEIKRGEPLGMLAPALAVALGFIRKCQAEDYVFKVFPKTFSEQSFYIFENKGSRTKFTDRAGGLREHVPLVLESPCEPPEGKRLAGWASRNQIHSFKLGKIKCADICFVNEVLREIEPQTLARPFVELDKGAMLESRVFKPLGQAAAAAE
nr:hypothetical protein [Ereboglobus sp. PH5-10]